VPLLELPPPHRQRVRLVGVLSATHGARCAWLALTGEWKTLD
jgi:hypothetical protein